MEWEYFTYEEFICQCGCKTNKMELGVITELNNMRMLLGFPLSITSGYRCENHPIEVSKSAGPGPHTTGFAADPTLTHSRADRFLELVYTRGYFTGKGVSQKGKKRFIHVDKCEPAHGRPRPHIWSY